MGVITVLDKAVAELIAAGEVVERPSSIVKELLENAVDAGATSISVEIKDGGVSYIRVTDDGSGILQEDIPKAFIRHATSKVRTADDLDGIETLGFRGEALASIAAMSRVELMTRTENETEGTLYRVEGGEYISDEPAGCPVGTTIIVRDVFYNTPARMKFLKRDVSEGNSVAQVVDKCALSNPDVAFRFIRDGATKLQTSGNGDLRAAIGAIYGRAFAADMLPVNYNYEDKVTVTGFISRPSSAKPSRTYQNFFINSRFVHTRTCAAALLEGYKGKLMVGRQPACVLNLKISPASVDVNVHPAKIEIRFINERPIFSAVYYAVKTVLGTLETPIGSVEEVSPVNQNPPVISASTSPAPSTPTISNLPQKTPQKQETMSAQEFRSMFDTSSKQAPPPSESLFSKPISLGSSVRSFNLDIAVDEPDHPVQTQFSDKTQQTASPKIFSEHAVESEPELTDTVEMDLPTPQPEQTSLDARPAYRMAGEVLGTYIILDCGDRVLLVDKHAAHERIRYEELVKGLANGHRQLLLAPQQVSLARDEASILLDNSDKLEQLGFMIEDFGGNTVLVREIPLELASGDIEYLLSEIAGKLLESRVNLTPALIDRLHYSIACKSAIRAGDKTSPEELTYLVERLRDNPQITHCPHGRPVSVALGRGEIEKLFGRQG